MPYHKSPNGSAGGRYTGLPPESGITPLTCTIFDPSFTALIYPRISFLYTVISGYLDYFPQIGSNRAEWMLVGHFIHFSRTRSQIGSRTLTRGNSSSFPFSHLKCNKSHSRFQFRFLPGKLFYFRKLLGIMLYLLVR